MVRATGKNGGGPRLVGPGRGEKNPGKKRKRPTIDFQVKTFSNLQTPFLFFKAYLNPNHI
jgi:hypothetical protein